MRNSSAWCLLDHNLHPHGKATPLPAVQTPQLPCLLVNFLSASRLPETAHGGSREGWGGARGSQEERNPEKEGERHIERRQRLPKGPRDTLVQRPRQGR